MPLFAAGANRANLDASEPEKLAEVASYERAIQTAFAEVSDTLSARLPLDRELVAGEALVAAQQKRLALAQARNRGGAGLENGAR